MRVQSTIDLHVHSTASDGLREPAEVVRIAAQAGLAAIALTDHDTTAGLAEAQASAAQVGLRVLSGVELSAESGDSEVHILGYAFQPNHPAVQKMLHKLRDAREERARVIVERLAELGMPVAWDLVLASSGDGAIGRPHIARVLVEAGYASDTNETFERWLGNGGPAYVPRFRLSTHDAIALIREAGGVPTLAHPGVTDSEELVPELAEAGLGGVEVYYAQHTEADVARLLDLCGDYGLVPTGGSDFHGDTAGHRSQPGSVFVPPDTVERLTGWARQHPPHAP